MHWKWNIFLTNAIDRDLGRVKILAIHETITRYALCQAAVQLSFTFPFDPFLSVDLPFFLALLAPIFNSLIIFSIHSS